MKKPPTTSKKSLTSESVRRVVVLPDMHVRSDHGRVRGVDLRAWAAVRAYMKANGPWDEVVNLGDFMDFGCISDHNANNLRAVENKTVAADYEAGNRILNEIIDASPGARQTLLEGNHEYRVERYINKFPQLAGSIEVPRGLHLAERGVRWVRSWSRGEVYRIGKAAFIHGDAVNDFHCKKNVVSYGENIFTGHMHDIQCYSLSTKGDNRTRVGQSLGCLCEYDQDYMKRRPNRWQQCFAVFFFLPNNFFNYYVSNIYSGQFVGIDGRVYGK